MQKITEKESHYKDLEQKDTREILEDINREDKKVAEAVAVAIPAIESLVNSALSKMQQGGRLFYIGAGTSGRLGILDASECPPTFGVPHEWVVGIIAGGDAAIRKAVEHAEDDENGAWRDLQQFAINSGDFVIGIAASGTTPYVIGGLKACRKAGITTGCIVCNPGAPLINEADYPIIVVPGPEYVTGSTRMKSGTAQKLVLNKISTSLMIRLGRVKGNKMVDMQLSNNKLIDRGTLLVKENLDISYEEAKQLLIKYGSVRKAIEGHIEH